MGIDIIDIEHANVMKSSACTTRPNGMRIACFFLELFVSAVRPSILPYTFIMANLTIYIPDIPYQKASIQNLMSRPLGHSVVGNVI